MQKEKGNKSLKPVKLDPIKIVSGSLACQEILLWFYLRTNYTIQKRASLVT